MTGTPAENNIPQLVNQNLQKTLKLALVGLPNTGKSQVFNNLTGDYSLVANYPETTLELKRTCCSIQKQTYEIIDTPGFHSLYIQSAEEMVIRNFIFTEKPDLLIQCIDANRLKQSLALTLELLELRIPLIISLNAVDETEQRGVTINQQKLQEILDVPVFRHIATQGIGTDKIRNHLSKMNISSFGVAYGEPLTSYLRDITDLLPEHLTFRHKKAELLLREDKYLLKNLTQELGAEWQTRIGKYLTRIKSETKGKINRLLSRKKDRLVDQIYEQVTVQPRQKPGKLAHTFARLSRHPVWGLGILAFFLLAIYWLVVHGAGWLTETFDTFITSPLVDVINRLKLTEFWQDFLIGPYGILTLGLFNALGTVLPLLSVFFLALGLLEDIGYLPNLTVLARRSLGKIGLSGKSIMSLILGFGCKTMATLTTRGISSWKEKFIAIYLIAFAIPCSAQLAINMGVLGKAGLAAFAIGAGSLLLFEILAGFILNKIIREEVKAAFIQELPPFRLPGWRAVIKKTYYRLYWFLKESLPVFIIASIILFVMDKTGLLNGLKYVLNPVITGWLGLPLDTVEVLILSLARHEAAAGLLYQMADTGLLDFTQIVVAVVVTTMFVPCFANIVAMCKELGFKTGISMALVINVSTFFIGGLLNWLLRAFSTWLF